jgi:hypothetical protein
MQDENLVGAANVGENPAPGTIPCRMRTLLVQPTLVRILPPAQLYRRFFPDFSTLESKVPDVGNSSPVHG